MKNLYRIILVSTTLAFAACGSANGQEQSTAKPSSSTVAEAVFAGGCFWCVEADFEKLPGVIEAISGFAGGHVANPSYKQVVHGGTGHYEAAKIIYDPTVVSYDELLEYFWTHIDPTDDGGQFCDRGPSYRTAIFASQAQIKAARASKKTLQESGRLRKKVVTQIIAAGPFYPAETYHQNYYKKNPIRYKYYRNGCGRDKRIKKVWGK